jgi:small lipoprotein (TIGR04454 family)
MKTIGLILVIALVGCGSKKGGASECADAIAKGLDSTMGKRLESAPPEMKQQMAAVADKLKGVLVNRCTEDKWSAEILDCTAKATSRDELKACQAKLPPEQAAKLQAEVIQAMTAGGMGMGMGRPHGGMGGMSGGSAMTPPPAGSDTAPASGSSAGSAM